jgi:trans-aconitate 2-methyltransferase
MKFAGPRLRPALDLLNQTIKVVSINQNPNEVKKILDLGCGPGNITQFLFEAFPNSTILGIDSSTEMIESANIIHKDKTNIQFNINATEHLSNDSSEKYDLIYTNAALHWSLNHEILFPNLINNLLLASKDNNNIGGILSIQMPDTRFV